MKEHAQQVLGCATDPAKHAKKMGRKHKSERAEAYVTINAVSRRLGKTVADIIDNLQRLTLRETAHECLTNQQLQ